MLDLRDLIQHPERYLVDGQPLLSAKLEMNTLDGTVFLHRYDHGLQERRVTPAPGVRADAKPSLPELGTEELTSACMSYRHDFGLLPQEERLTLLSDAAAWAHALGFPIKRGTAGAMKATAGVSEPHRVSEPCQLGEACIYPRCRAEGCPSGVKGSSNG
jgi:hypothetical protein